MSLVLRRASSSPSTGCNRISSSASNTLCMFLAEQVLPPFGRRLAVGVAASARSASRAARARSPAGAARARRAPAPSPHRARPAGPSRAIRRPALRAALRARGRCRLPWPVAWRDSGVGTTGSRLPWRRLRRWRQSARRARGCIRPPRCLLAPRAPDDAAVGAIHCRGQQDRVGPAEPVTQSIREGLFGFGDVEFGQSSKQAGERRSGETCAP